MVLLEVSGDKKRYGKGGSTLISVLTVIMLIIVMIPLMGKTDAKDTITLNSPNGGESWTAGSVQSIRWSISDTGGFINISLSKDGGHSWNVITNIQNDPSFGRGRYDWTIPANINSTSCRIRVTWFDLMSPKPLARDESDANFSIEFNVHIEFTENPGTVAYGKYYLTRWNLYDPRDLVAGLRFSIRTDNGSGWGDWGSINSYLDWADPKVGWIWWTPPYFENGRCQIRVEAMSKGNVSNLFTETTPIFDIISPSVTLIQPDGGITMVAGSTYTIKWRTSQDPEEVIHSVSISYSIDGGSTWKSTGFLFIDNNFEYDWTVPNEPTTRLRIRVISLIGDPIEEWKPYAEDSSSGDNTIISDLSVPSVTLLDPNPPVEGGVVIGSGEIYPIEWDFTGTGSIVSLHVEYSTDNGTSFNPITTISIQPPFIPLVHSWTAPAVDTYEARVRLTITISGEPSKSVMSNHPFYIFDTIPFNRPPVAMAKPKHQEAMEGEEIYLDGTGSYDPDGDPLTYIWTQIEPHFMTAELNNHYSPMPQFNVSLTHFPVTFIFELEVRDGVDHEGVLLFNIDRLSVTVHPSPPTLKKVFPKVGWKGTYMTLTGSDMMGAEILLGDTVMTTIPTTPLQDNPDPDTEYTFMIYESYPIGVHEITLSTISGNDTYSEQIEIFPEPLWQYEHGIGFANNATKTLNYPANPSKTGRYRDAFDLQVYLTLWVCIGIPYWTLRGGWKCEGYLIEEPFAPDPLAALFYGAVFHHMAREGECFGMSTTALQHYHGDLNKDQFGQSVAEWSDLEREGALMRYIQWRQGAQMSAEILNKYLGTLINGLVPSSSMTGMGVWVSDMKSLIDSGKLGVATMICNEGAHAVVPYAYEDTGDKVRFYVYDPNREQFSDPETAIESARSNDPWKQHPPYIEINRSPTYWRWSFRWTDGTLWSSKVGLAMVDYDTINGKRTMPLSIEGIFNLLAGSADVVIEDESGGQVGVDETGSILWDIPDAYPLPKFGGAGSKPSSYLLPDGNYTTHITGSEDGSYNWSNIKDNSSAFYIEDADVNKGSNDTVSVTYPDGNTYQGEMLYGTDDDFKGYNATVVHDYGEGFRTFKVNGAQLSSDDDHGNGLHSIKVTEEYDGLVFTNLGGGSTTFDVEFTSNVLCHVIWNSTEKPQSPNIPTASRSGITVEPGETVVVKPLNWMNLNGTVVVIDGETVPEAPIDLNIEPDENRVLLEWDPPAYDGGWPILEYQVLKGTSPDDLSPIASTNRTWFADEGTERNMIYHYAVMAVNILGNSEPSEILSIFIPGIVNETPELPGPPENLTAVLTDEGALLSWDPPGNDVSGYVVLRAEGDEDLSRLAQTEVEEFLDDSIKNDTSYRYAVLAFNEAGEGPISSEVGVYAPKEDSIQEDPIQEDDSPSWILWALLAAVILLIVLGWFFIASRRSEDASEE